MGDQPDLLTQLAQLHAQGILTDTEYEAKKAALSAIAKDPAPENAEAVAKDYPLGARIALFTFLAAIVIVGLYFLARAADSATASSAHPSNSSAALADAGSGPWTIESTSDPMTDAVVKTAKANFEGQNYNISVEVSCRSTGELSYTADSFDKAEKPVAMRSSVSSYGANTVFFQARADDGEQLYESTTNPKYSNQVFLSSNYLFPISGHDSQTLAAAYKVTLRLSMVSGEETIVIPQGDPKFRDVVDSCLPQKSSASPSGTTAQQNVPTSGAVAAASDAGSLPARTSSPAPTSSDDGLPSNFTPLQKKLALAEIDLDEACRGGPNSSDGPVCNARDKASDRMNAAGVCFGKDSDESAADYNYHLCAPGSFGYHHP